MSISTEDSVSASTTATGAYNEWKSEKLTTVLAVIAASVGEFCMGTVLTFSSPVLADPNFLDKFPDIDNGSWFATTSVLGALLSAPFSGIINAELGRKGTMLVFAFPFFAGWMMVAFAPNVYFLYVGRVVTGYCGGIFAATVPQYISEIAEDSIREALGEVYVLMKASGYFLTLLLGAYVNWTVLAVICGLLPMLSFFCMLNVPESPRHLIISQKPSKARLVLKWLRRVPSKSCIDPEFATIVSSVVEESLNYQRRKFKDVIGPGVLRPVAIGCALMFFCQFSAMIGIALHTVRCRSLRCDFREAGTDVNANLMSILIGAANVLTVLVVPITLGKKVGRHSFLIISKLITFLSFLALGTFFYLKDQNIVEAPEYLRWLPIISLISITIIYNIGPATVPWVIASEIIPNGFKEPVTLCVSMWYWTIFYIAGKSFQDAKEALGYTWVYWISAVVSPVGASFVYLFVPDTKGTGTEETQKVFLSKLTDNCSTPGYMDGRENANKLVWVI